MIPTVVAERLLARRVVAASGCWLYTGYRNRDGYGRISIGSGVVRGVHRVSYEAFVGPIPDGLTVDHLCHTTECTAGDECPHRACFNPAHLALATATDNKRRGTSPFARRARQTECVHGHPFDAANTYYGKRGRQCRACRTAAVRAAKAKWTPEQREAERSRLQELGRRRRRAAKTGS